MMKQKRNNGQVEHMTGLKSIHKRMRTCLKTLVIVSASCGGERRTNRETCCSESEALTVRIVNHALY
jgi:hypothetical protein